MKALKVIGFVFLSLLLWALGFLAICLIVEDVDKIGVIVILYFLAGIIAIVLATKRFIKNGYCLNQQCTRLPKHGECEAKLTETKSLTSDEVECHIKQLQYSGFDPDGENIKVYDELLPQAIDVVFDTKQASASILQRRMQIGYTRALKILDEIEDVGIVGPFEASRPRQILITKDQWNSIKHNFNFRAASSTDAIDAVQLLQDENEWRRAQLEASPEDYELYRIDHMEGHAFEHWCADLLQKNGFINVEVTRASNDQGVDILAEKDRIKYAIQCKCYSADLGNTPIQEVNTGKAIYHCHVGAVMTNRHFTAGAKEAAKANNILLWDRDYIAELLKNSL